MQKASLLKVFCHINHPNYEWALLSEHLINIEGEKILEEIKNGKKFGVAAKEISTCPSSKKEGDLGYFTKGMMVKEFEDVAFTLNIGDISEPIKSEFGYHIIKRLG